MGHTRSSWGVGRSRRHAAWNLTHFPPPKPTPVPDDDDEFDWPGASENGVWTGSEFAHLYAVSEADDCFTFLLGQDDPTGFRTIVTRRNDADVTQVVARRYDNGTGTNPLVWCANPLVPGTNNTRILGQYVTDHVLYSKVCKTTGTDWLADRAAHTAWLNTDNHFFKLLKLEPAASKVSKSSSKVDASGQVIASTESIGGGFTIEWKAVKVSLFGTSGHGADGTPRHFTKSQMAWKTGSSATTETYDFGPTSFLQAKEPNGNSVRGGFLVAYGLYVRHGGPHGPQEFYAVSPPLSCEHPWQIGAPEAP